MRKTLILACALLLLCCVGVARAADNTWATHFASEMTGASALDGAFYSYGGTVRYNGVPVVLSAYLTGDTASSRFYILAENGSTTTTSSTAGASQKIVNVSDTDIFTCTSGGGSWVGLYNAGTKKFEVGKISSCSSDVSITLIANLTNAYATNTTVYELEPLYSIPVGAATVRDSSTMLPALKGKIAGWYLNGTGVSIRTIVTGTYR
jgi:hypothetical protein